MFFNAWRYVSNFGISEDMTPIVAKRFVLSNRFAVFAIIITYFYIFFFAFHGYVNAVFAEVGLILAYITVLMIAKVGYIKYSRFLLLIVANVHVYIVSLIFGEAALFYILYAPLAIAPLVLYERKQWRILLFFAFLSLFLVFDLFRMDFSSILFVSPSDTIITSFKLASILATVICELIIAYGLVLSSEEVEKELGDTNLLLEDRFRKIFNNTSDALLLIDAENMLIMEANNRAIELFEVKRESDFYAYRGMDLLKNPLTDNERLLMRNSILANGFLEGEALYKSMKGREFWGNFAIRLFTTRGRLYQVVRVTDITEKRKINEVIKNSLHEKEVLLAEIHHRVKNNLAVISGLLGLQASHTHDEKIKELFEESRNRIYSMALIHEKLYQNETFSRIQMDSYLNDLIYNIKKAYVNPETDITFIVKTNNALLDIKHAVPSGLLLNEIISNATKHAFKNRSKGEITVGFTREENRCSMVVSDNGIGFDIESALKNEKSMGMMLINALVNQIDGKIVTFNDNGLTFIISFTI